MNIYIYICINIYIYICTYIYVYIYTYVYICVHVYIYIYVYTYVYMYVYSGIYIYLQMCMNIYIYLFIYRCKAFMLDFSSNVRENIVQFMGLGWFTVGGFDTYPLQWPKKQELQQQCVRLSPCVFFPKITFFLVTLLPVVLLKHQFSVGFTVSLTCAFLQKSSNQLNSWFRMI